MELFCIIDQDGNSFMYGEWVDIVSVSFNSVHSKMPEGVFHDGRKFSLMSIIEADKRIRTKIADKLVALKEALKEAKAELDKTTLSSKPFFYYEKRIDELSGAIGSLTRYVEAH